MLAVLAALAALPALAAPATAWADSPQGLVPGHPGVTYLRLLRQVVPDLAADPATGELHGHLDKALRHPAGKDYGGDPPDPIVVTGAEALSIHSGGRVRLIVLADLGQSDDRVASTTLLALYDDSPQPRLLDAIDVGMDRDTSFSEHPRLALGPGDDALVTYSEHSNSSQTYSSWLFLFVRGDRFQRLATLFALSSRACGWQDLEAPTFITRADPGRPYRRLDITVSETITNDGTTGCGDDPVPRPAHHTYRATYRWNPARQRFETASPDLKRLDRSNRARF
ncbi:hypothetical protein ACO2Q3_00470 [Caulobacter sp. KR2-114]|uniref:hypothetical protein n=1 Tax=Caulobacter sp. KR2-114 TaxID=3400912 RepID=UPI003C03B3DE